MSRQSKLSSFYPVEKKRISYTRTPKRKIRQIQTKLTDVSQVKKKQKVQEWPGWVLNADGGSPLNKRQFESIEIFPREKGRERGAIRVLKIYNRFNKHVLPEMKKWPVVIAADGVPYDRYNVCKNTKYQDLSPMILGPVYTGTPQSETRELYAYNIEDGWQCSKVWRFHEEQGMQYWKEWSRRGRFSREARRHRIPAKPNQGGHATNKNIPLYSLYEGQKMSYLEARKKMYMPWYEELVVHTNAYKDLLNKHLSGVNLLLLEYDGLHRDKAEDNVDLTEQKLKELIDDESRPFGHGLVLAAMLLGYPVWRDYKKQEIIE